MGTEREQPVGPGTVVGPARLLGTLGKGASSSVFEAELVASRPYAEVGRRVALKLLRLDTAEDTDARERLRREFEVGRELRHENLVRVFELGEDEAHGPFVVQELIEGRSLAALLAAQGALPEPFVRALGARVARALSALHEAGAVHRDLKPANVLVTSDHRVKLADFGIASLATDAWRRSGRRGFSGTPVYASPEQFTGDEPGPLGDLYSLGVLLFEAASGSPPFLGRDFEELMLAHLEREPARLTSRGPAHSALLCELVASLLAKTPEERPVSARLVAETLDEGERSEWWRRRRGSRPSLPATLRAHGDAPVGRDAEVQRLTELTATLERGRGGAALVVGRAGFGKSCLVAEVASRALRRQDSLTVLLGASAAADPFADALVSGFGDALADRLTAWLPHRSVLLPAFAAWLRREPPPRDAEPLPPGLQRELVVEALQAAADEQPVLLVIEDLHRAPGEAWRTLDSLAAAVDSVPLVLLATSRDCEAARERTDLNLVDLGPLPVAALEELAAREGAASIPQRTLADIVARANGSPFFLRELVRHARWTAMQAGLDGGPLAQTADSAPTTEVPASIRALVDERMAALDTDSRELLRAASIQGTRLDPDWLARTTRSDPIELLERLSVRVEPTGLVQPRSGAFAFEHPLIAEAIAESLSEEERRAWHARTAEAFVALHGLRDVDPEGLSAEHALTLARHRLAAGQTATSWPVIARALDGLEAGHGSSESLLELADAALADTPANEWAERCRLELRRAPALHRLARRAEEREAIEEAARLSERAGDPRLRGLALMRQAEFRLRVEGAAAATRTLEQALEQARIAGDVGLEIEALGGLGIAAVQRGLPRDAETFLRAELERASEVDHPGGEAHAVTYLAMVALDSGRMDEALELGRRAVELRRRLGLRMGEGIALGNLGQVLARRGQIVEAVELLEQALVLYEEIGYRHGESATCSGLGGLREWLGDLAASRGWFERAAGIALSTGDVTTETSIRCSLARLSLLEGDVESAAALSREAKAAADARGERRSQLRARLNLAEACAEDDPATARSASLEAAELAAETGGPQAEVEVALQRARLLSESDHDESAKLLERAVAVVAEHGLVQFAARPEAWLAWLGRRDAKDIEIDPRSPVASRAEAHVLLHLAGAGRDHDIRARELLGQLSCHLDAAAQDRFWLRQPVARLLGRAGDGGPREPSAP